MLHKKSTDMNNFASFEKIVSAWRYWCGSAWYHIALCQPSLIWFHFWWTINILRGMPWNQRKEKKILKVWIQTFNIKILDLDRTLPADHIAVIRWLNDKWNQKSFGNWLSQKLTHLRGCGANIGEKIKEVEPKRRQKGEPNRGRQAEEGNRPIAPWKASSFPPVLRACSADIFARSRAVSVTWMDKHWPIYAHCVQQLRKGIDG